MSPLWSTSTRTSRWAGAHYSKHSRPLNHPPCFAMASKGLTGFLYQTEMVHFLNIRWLCYSRDPSWVHWNPHPVSKHPAALSTANLRCRPRIWWNIWLVVGVTTFFCWFKVSCEQDILSRRRCSDFNVTRSTRLISQEAATVIRRYVNGSASFSLRATATRKLPFLPPDSDSATIQPGKPEFEGKFSAPN